MERQNQEEFNHVTKHHITQLATKADVSREYVKKLLTGEAPGNTITAKAILAAAKTLNQAIEKGINKATKDLIIIGEND
jgi:transcriptional regulator with XRE-family HTH domain